MPLDLSVRYDYNSKLYAKKLDELLLQFHGKIKDTTSDRRSKYEWNPNYYSWRSKYYMSRKKEKKFGTTLITFSHWSDAERFRLAIERLEWITLVQ